MLAISESAVPTEHGEENFPENVVENHLYDPPSTEGPLENVPEKHVWCELAHMHAWELGMGLRVVLTVPQHSRVQHTSRQQMLCDLARRK